MYNSENLNEKLTKARRSAMLQIAMFSFNIFSLFPIFLILLVSYINTNDESYRVLMILIWIPITFLFISLYLKIIKNAKFILNNFKSKSTFWLKILSFSPFGSIFVLIFCIKYDKKHNFNYKYDAKYMNIMSMLLYFVIIPTILTLLISLVSWKIFINYWYIIIIPLYIYLILLIALIICFNKINWYHKIPKKYYILISTLPLLFFPISPILFSIIINKLKKSFTNNVNQNISPNNIKENENQNYNFTFINENNDNNNKYEILNKLLDDYKNKKITKEEFDKRKNEII